MDFPYEPRCSIYLNSKFYYLSYYLPNGRRILKSLRTKRKAQAKKFMYAKEQELYEGIYDKQDVLKMPEYSSAPTVRLDLNSGVKKYLDATSFQKNQRSHLNDQYALRSLVSKMDKVYVDEINSYDVQILLAKLKSENKSDASLKTYRGILKKFFLWVIEHRLVHMESPVSRQNQIKKSSTLVRNRLPSYKEIQAIVISESEIQPLVRFLCFTGARLGEALHLEWEDIEDGFWKICHKPECPTKFSRGWHPKWGKSRKIPLMPEALDVWERQPRISRWVFPKKDGSRRDSITKSWKTLKTKAQVFDLQIKDLRNWFNHFLKQEHFFTSKEASSYLGHSPLVNETHYEPISKERILRKLKRIPTATNLLQKQMAEKGITL